MIYRLTGLLLLFGALTVALPLHALDQDETEADIEEVTEEATREMTKEERIEYILTEAMPESEYRKISRCLPARQIKDVEVLSDRFILFHGRRDKVWVNELRQRCHGLRRNQILEFRRFGLSLCDFDQVKAHDRFSRGFGARASCTLGEFEEINEERVEALKVAIKQAKRS